MAPPRPDRADPAALFAPVPGLPGAADGTLLWVFRPPLAEGRLPPARTGALLASGVSLHHDAPGQVGGPAAGPVRLGRPAGGDPGALSLGPEPEEPGSPGGGSYCALAIALPDPDQLLPPVRLGRESLLGVIWTAALPEGSMLRLNIVAGPDHLSEMKSPQAGPAGTVFDLWHLPESGPFERGWLDLILPLPLPGALHLDPPAICHRLRATL